MSVLCRDNVAIEVPLCDRDGHEKRSGLRRSLAKAKRFHVATDICSIIIGFHGVVSR